MQFTFVNVCIMNKKFMHTVHVVTLDKFGDVLSDENMVLDKAFERFSYLVSLHLSIGFRLVRAIRVVNGQHILYEFRDIRAIPKQDGFDDYFSNYKY